MKKICITEADKKRLEEMIDNILRSDLKNRKHLNAIQTEIDRADIATSVNVPAEVITMGAKVILSIGEAEDEEYTLAYPEDADILHNKISILAPIGTAILGYREGDTIKWEVPGGFTLIKVKKIVYQKESVQGY